MAGGKSQQCKTCLDKTTESDGICPMCKANVVVFTRDEIEAMLQYDKRQYEKVEISGRKVIVTVFKET